MRRYLTFFVFLFCLLLTFAVYKPGLSGDFAFDDWSNILQNKRIHIESLDAASLKQAALSGTSGLLKRPLSMLSFALNYYAVGAAPYFFKLTNLFIHLLNGLGIFTLTWLLLVSYGKRQKVGLPASHVQWLSLAVATAWLLHPLNLTTVLYVVQRMAGLSAFFTIWGLVSYIWGRSQLGEQKRGIILILVSFLVFTPLAVLSKESGILLPFFLLLVEIVLFNFEAPKATRYLLIGIFSITVVLPSVGFLVYIAVHPEWLLESYQIRGFTLAERLMTEARVLWFYLQMVVMPSGAKMGIFHDDIEISRGLFSPISTFFSIAGIIALFGLAFASRKRWPLLTFGILFYFVGHSLESTIFGLEIAHEHRNYMPMYGVLLVVFYYLLYPFGLVKSLRLRRMGAVLFISMLGVLTTVRASYWGNPFDHSLAEVEHHPDSARANHQMGRMYANLADRNTADASKYYLLAQRYYERNIALQENGTEGLFGLVILSSSQNKPVSDAWLKELARRLENLPFTENSANLLANLVACKKTEECKLSKGDIEVLLQAALRNASLSGLAKAATLAAAGEYFLAVRHNYPEAIKAAQLAIEAAPQELQYRLNLVTYLIALRQINAAKEQLIIVKQLDKLQGYRPQIEAREKLLSNLQRY